MTISLTQKQRIFYIPRPARLTQYVAARLYPPKIESNAISSVLKQYGLELTEPPRNLPLGRRNRIVVVNTANGKKVLKLYKQRWQLPAVLHEHSILTNLEQNNFLAPRLVPALNGETWVRLGDQLFALFGYIDGTNFSSVFLPRSHRQKLLALAGKTLAQFHQTLEGFLPEGQHHLGYESYSEDRQRDLGWHLNVLNELAERSQGRVDSEDKVIIDWLIENKNYIQDRLCQIDETLSKVSLPLAVIHGDYGIHNLQFHSNGTVTVHDFELARLEWRLIDLVIVVSRTGIERSRSLMTAYQAEYPLSSEEWRLFPQIWQHYKLRGAIQYCNTFFEIGGSYRLVAAQERVRQADWAATHAAQLWQLRSTLEERLL